MSSWESYFRKPAEGIGFAVAPSQVTLLILESDQIKHTSFDKTGFADVVVMGTSSGSVIGDTVQWAREQRFDVVFFPQVRLLRAPYRVWVPRGL
jgi:hypothetical protein